MNPASSASRLVGVLLASAALAGCMATWVHNPESVSLCRTVAANGWQQDGAHWTRTVGSTELSIDIRDHRARPEKVGPIDNVHWVEIDAHVRGPDSRSHRLPVLLDPAGVVIEIDGRQVHALERAWELQARMEPGTEVRMPLNLNDPDTTWTDGYAIAFPMSHPTPRQSYVLRGGPLRVGATSVALPDVASCHEDASSDLSPIH